MEIFILILFFGGIIGGIVLLIRYAKRAGDRKVQWYQNWGRELNLTHESNKYMLTKLNTLYGPMEGETITIYEKIVGSGKNQTLQTNIVFEPNPFDFEFSIAREGFFSKAGKLFGGGDIEFGDEEFDKKFLLKSKDEAKFRSLMDFRAQEELRRIEKKLAGTISSTPTNFNYYFMGGFTKEEKIKEFNQVLDFMRMLIRNKR